MPDDAPQLAADPFIISGLTLFGRHWKAPLARALGVSRETVSRWASSGDIPKWARIAVARLIAAKGSVLSLCDRTGIMVKPWAEAGFECFCVDIQHPPGETRRGNITFIGADLRLRDWFPPPRRYAIVFGFPPCTNLAASGARWMAGKGLAGLTEGVELVEACRRICEWSAAPWVIENPVGTLSTYWRKPDFTFHPHQFGGWPGGEGDDYGKKTCLWVGGGFRSPRQRPIPVSRPQYIHTLPPSAERGDLRSVTPAGFARAVFEANAGRAAEGQVRRAAESPAEGEGGDRAPGMC